MISPRRVGWLILLLALVALGFEVGREMAEEAPATVPGRVYSSATLGVACEPTVDGWRVTAVSPTGAVPFACGTTLQVGDTILSVGSESAARGERDLEQMIQKAKALDNPVVVVRGVKGGGDAAFMLP